MSTVDRGPPREQTAPFVYMCLRRASWGRCRMRMRVRRLRARGGGGGGGGGDTITKHHIFDGLCPKIKK